MTVFRYRQELTNSNEIIHRPVADVSIKTVSGEWIEFHPYIDSGADVTLIPFSFGKLIGLKTDEKKIEQIGGIRGSVPVIYHHCIIRIGLYGFPIKLAWTLIEEVPPLLGRSEMFDYFSITFKQHQKTITFEKSQP